LEWRKCIQILIRPHLAIYLVLCLWWQLLDEGMQYERKEVVNGVQNLKGAFRPHSELHDIILSFATSDGPTNPIGNVVVESFTTPCWSEPDYYWIICMNPIVKVKGKLDELISKDWKRITWVPQSNCYAY
jgi:hypothetical protein